MRRLADQRERIVSLAPSVTSILFALGARSQVVGVSKWCKDVVDIGRLPQVGDCWAGETDQIFRTKPTLVIGSVPYKLEIVEKLLQAPFTFVATNPRSLSDIFRDIRHLGALVRRAGRAEQLISRMRRSLDSVARHTRRVSNDPLVYAESWPNPHITSPPWVSELIEIAGGTPALPPGQRVSKEEIVQARPDVFIIAWTATGSRPRTSQVLGDPTFATVPAVRNRRVHVVRDAVLNTPGPPVLDGARELLRLLHPESERKSGDNRRCRIDSPR